MQKSFLFKFLALITITNLLGISFIGTAYSLLLVPVNLSLIILALIMHKSMKYGSTIFHPLPLTCIILMISFIFPPLISYYFKVYLLYAPRQIDWDYWLIYLSWLYFIGIIIFYIGVKVSFKATFNKRNFDIAINKKKLILISGVFLVFTFLSQIFVFYKHGGIISYLNKFTESKEDFGGLGIWYMLAEPFPIIFLIFTILLFGKKNFKKSLINITILFLVFFSLKMIFGGLRGSRSNTIWGLFWFAGIVHLYLFKLKKVHYLIGIAFLVIFMSTYSIYKTFGVESFSGEYSIKDTNRFENNPLIEIYLGDFSRATMNAYQVAQIHDIGDYEVKYGQTYIASFIKILPPLDALYTGHTKNSAGSEILNNIKVEPTQDDIHNSRVFGIYGEGILNFGIIIGLLGFFIFGIVASLLDNISRKTFSNNIFIFIIPFVANFSFAIATSDSDNLVFFAFKNGLIVILYLLCIHKMCEVRYIRG